MGDDRQPDGWAAAHASRLWTRRAESLTASTPAFQLVEVVRTDPTEQIPLRNKVDSITKSQLLPTPSAANRWFEFVVTPAPAWARN